MAAGIGSAIMRAGGAIAGSKAARSTAGSMLQSGTSDSVSAMLKLINKNADKIYSKIQKVVSILENASPAFKQQMIILSKSISVFLRPIGDIMAKFIRPMAIWFLKIAVLWYKWLGGKFGLGGSGDKEDAKQLDEFIKAKGPETGDAAGQLPGGGVTGSWDSPTESAGTSNFFDAMKKTADDISTLIPEVFEETMASGDEMFSNLGEVLQSVWDIIGPLVTAVWDLVTVIGGTLLLAALFAVNGALTLVNLALDGLVIVLDWLKLGIDVVMVWIENLCTWLETDLPLAFKVFEDFILIKIPEWISSMVENVKGVVQKIIDWIKSLNWFGKNDDEGNAAGGLVPKSGMYKLHAGERIMTAGQEAQSSNKSINIVNNFNIPSTINSNLDIRELAMKLADYSERELRRRVSYF